MREAAILRRTARGPGSVVIPEGALELHEAAHATAAYFLVGATAIERVYLNPLRPPKVIKMSELGEAEEAGALIWVDDPPLNEAVANKTPHGQLSEEIIHRARGRLIANIAGVYGADLAGGELITHPLSPMGGDAAQVQAMAYLLGDWDDDGAAAIEREANIDARAFVQRREREIRALADVLETRRTLTGAQVVQILAGTGQT